MLISSVPAKPGLFLWIWIKNLKLLSLYYTTNSFFLHQKDFHAYDGIQSIYKVELLMLFVIIAICLIVLVAVYACLCMSSHDD